VVPVGMVASAEEVLVASALDEVATRMETVPVLFIALVEAGREVGMVTEVGKVASDDVATAAAFAEDVTITVVDVEDLVLQADFLVEVVFWYGAPEV